jgi:DNA-binding transcriptional MerR regulator
VEVVKLMTINDVSELLRVPVGTLRYWRHRNLGPKGAKLPGTGRLMYREEDVKAWVNQAFESGAA